MKFHTGRVGSLLSRGAARSVVSDAVGMETMANAGPSSSPVRLAIREIADADFDSVVNLLVRGFPRPRRYWEIRLERLRTRFTPPNRELSL